LGAIQHYSVRWWVREPGRFPRRRWKTNGFAAAVTTIAFSTEEAECLLGLGWVLESEHLLDGS
jgi:hypothetical protein